MLKKITAVIDVHKEEHMSCQKKIIRPGGGDGIEGWNIEGWHIGTETGGISTETGVLDAGTCLIEGAGLGIEGTGI